jgi:hypothetical protein
MSTLDQYNEVITACKAVYVNKTTDYGTSWRVYRSIAIADQIYIKAWRIRQIQVLGVQKVADSIESEFMAIVNYGLMALIQLQLSADTNWELPVQDAVAYYDQQVTVVRDLMMAKNHDYGEAWRELSQASFVDLILTKILRIRQILSNDGKTIISEGIDANFADIINYAIFAIIKIKD